MAVPVLGLNLAPHPSLWRQQHKTLGWTALAAGSLFLMGALGFSWRAYYQARRAGRDAVSLTEEARRVARREQEIQGTLQDIDATKEQARWKLAERILQERSLPWSRLTTELERCMVPDMRLRTVQRVRGAEQQVVMKLKGEARTAAAESDFIGALRKAPVFDQVILEREAERPGGGWDFELTLPVVAIPPPFQQSAPTPVRKGAATAPSSPAPAPAAPAPRPLPVVPPQGPAAVGRPGPAPVLQAPTPETIQTRPVPMPRRRVGRPRQNPRDDRSPE
ncbi:hypothetical protein GETHPA_29430 [Geothrix rubra]|uniref:PilN domain-containing protein n=1 Tax=Geothrix rubra TaxID=2927977 RepID=A0ABQ5Q9A7_9BACT|nr:hypothetical protein [Geothrix rubra]GLH71409.1 hypothetical protein GETHPA_29430 [Geothrix rubra]